MQNQLVMFEEEQLQINEICEGLHRDANAKAILCIDKNGQAIASAGGLRPAIVAPDMPRYDPVSLQSEYIASWLELAAQSVRAWRLR